MRKRKLTDFEIGYLEEFLKDLAWEYRYETVLKDAEYSLYEHETSEITKGRSKKPRE